MLITINNNNIINVNMIINSFNISNNNDNDDDGQWL